jgi:hypothetical protein
MNYLIFTKEITSDPADEMVLEAAAHAQVHAIVTYKLRDFGLAKLLFYPRPTRSKLFKTFA